jgi:hypothetical protein
VTKEAEPIKTHQLACSSTHCAAALDNLQSDNGRDIEYGRDVMTWGGNAEGQLAREDGKKGSAPLPGWMKCIDYDGSSPVGRLQLAPSGKCTTHGKRTVVCEQRIVCGPHMTAVYTKVL